MLVISTLKYTDFQFFKFKVIYLTHVVIQRNQVLFLIYWFSNCDLGSPRGFMSLFSSISEKLGWEREHILEPH